MKISIVTPQSASASSGNQITAKRWARMLRSLGNRVRVKHDYRGEASDLLIALHAKRSARSIATFRQAHPHKPIIVALTGTDLHRDVPRFSTARRSLKLATRLVLLEGEGLKHLSSSSQEKAVIIYQSATPVVPKPKPARDLFEVCVIGHLRSVKDPLRCAMAVRNLPADSKIRVVQLGAPLSEAYRVRAQREEQRNARYRWLGELPHQSAKRRMAKCRLLVLTSRIEGAPSVISEAIVSDVPIVATRITGTVGLLGCDYPGLFPVGATNQLRTLLLRAEGDATFLRSLKAACRSRKSIFSPARETQSWANLLGELT